MADQAIPGHSDSIIGRSATRARHAGIVSLAVLAAAAIGLIILNGREPYGALPEP